MESEATRQVNNVIAPVASATPGAGVMCITTAITAAAVDLYDSNGNPRPDLYCRYLTLMADGDDIYVAFSATDAPAIDKTAGGATVALGSLATIPWLLKNGVPQRVRLPYTSLRYLHTQAAANTPKLRILPSSQPAFCQPV
jgi:hypothetical protein